MEGRGGGVLALLDLRQFPGVEPGVQPATRGGVAVGSVSIGGQIDEHRVVG